MKYYFIFYIISIALITCTQRKTSTYHNPIFVQATIDLLYLQERYVQKTTLVEDSINIILDNYDLTQKKYNRIIQDLNSKPERWEAFLQEVLDQINRFDDSEIEKIDPRQYLTNLKKSGK